MSERDGLKIIDQLPLDFDRKACPSKGGAPFSWCARHGHNLTGESPERRG